MTLSHPALNRTMVEEVARIVRTPTALLVFIATTFASVIVWGVHLEDKVSSMAQRLDYIDQHGTSRFGLLEERQATVTRDVAEIKAKLDRNNEQMADLRDLIRGQYPQRHPNVDNHIPPP